MSIQRYLMVYPIPQLLGAVASTLQGVRYLEKTQCLLVPAVMFVDYAKGRLPTIPNAADWALCEALTAWTGTPKCTMPLSVKVATDATRAAHRERQHHYLIGRGLLDLAIVQALLRLAGRIVLAVIKFPFKLGLLVTLMMTERLMQPRRTVTGKKPTKNYQ